MLKMSVAQNGSFTDYGLLMHVVLILRCRCESVSIAIRPFIIIIIIL